ncbi:MAG: hypothetical protein Q7Q71_00285 [Verrucomicrobiota bacterium JB023]|nr:hypothetical protein [Verrucomicrobiota bacterium JB023]
MRHVFSLLGAVLAGGMAGGKTAYLTDQNLGDITDQNTEVIGDTSAGGGTTRDVATYHLDVTSSRGNWGRERIYQFTVSKPSYLEISVNTVEGDPDYILLDDLGVEDDEEGKAAATGALSAIFLDEDTSGFLASVYPGTYYLAIEHFDGFDEDIVEGDAQFDVDLMAREASALELASFIGPVASAYSPLSFDTFGSGEDTALALYAEDGTLVASNDDAGGGVESELAPALGLAAGRYYIVAGPGGATFDDDFSISADGDLDGQLNFSRGAFLNDGREDFSLDSSYEGSAVKFFAFDVVTRPTVIDDLGQIAREGEAVTFDLFDSNFDTELAIYGAQGFYYDFNEDFDFSAGLVTSYLHYPEGMPVGEWYLLVAGYENRILDGFEVETLGDIDGVAGETEFGNYVLDFDVGTRAGQIESAELAWYRFEIGPAETSELAITSISTDREGGTVTLQWTPIAGATFAIQADADGSGNFANLAGQTGLSGTSATFAVDFGAEPTALYRVVEE